MSEPTPWSGDFINRNVRKGSTADSLLCYREEIVFHIIYPMLRETASENDEYFPVEQSSLG